MENQTENCNSSNSSCGSCCGPIDWKKLTERAKAVLTNPTGIWTTIKSEPATVQSLYREWLCVMAAIPAVCGFIGLNLFGLPMMDISFIGSLGHGVFQYVIGLAGIFLFSFILLKLAPTFGGNTDQVSTLKLVAYSATPSFVFGILSLYPMLGMLGGLLSLYGLYILWQGIPAMTGVGPDKRLQYFGASFLASFVAGFIIMIVVGQFSPSIGTPRPFSINGQEIDLQKFEKTMQDFQKMIPQPGN